MPEFICRSDRRKTEPISANFRPKTKKFQILYHHSMHDRIDKKSISSTVPLMHLIFLALFPDDHSLVGWPPPGCTAGPPRQPAPPRPTEAGAQAVQLFSQVLRSLHCFHQLVTGSAVRWCRNVSGPLFRYFRRAVCYRPLSRHFRLAVLRRPLLRFSRPAVFC